MPRLDGRRWSQRIPSRRISPSVRSSRPAIILSSVDFPQPEGPTNTVNEPVSTVKSIPWITSIDWKLFRTLISSRCATLVRPDNQSLARPHDAPSAKQDEITVTLGRLPVDDDAARQGRQPQPGHGQFPASDRQDGGAAAEFHLAPSAAGRAEIYPILRARWTEADLVPSLIEAQPAPGIQQSVA
jgi:hypothetical protein